MATSRKHAGSFTGSPTAVPLRSSAPVTHALPDTCFGQARAASFRYLTLHTPSGAGYYLLDLAFA